MMSKRPSKNRLSSTHITACKKVANIDELAGLSSEISQSCLSSSATTAAANPTTTSNPTSSQEGPLLLIDVIVNESATQYENEIKKIFKDIEDTNQLEETLLKRLESLLREDGKNFERISDARIGYENYSMLHCAAKANRPNLCAFFIDEINIDVDILTKSKQTPLHLLLKNIPHNNNNSNELVNLRLKETLQVFCERNVNLNIQSEQQGCSLIHLAVVRQNRTAVQLLLNQSSLNLEIRDVNQMSPLRVASQLDDEEILNMLIEKTHFTNYLLKECPLLHLIASCKPEKYTPFKKTLDYIKSNHQLNHQTILNSPDDQSKTVLEICIQNNHFNLISLILNELTDKEAFDANGQLPIHLAAKYGTHTLYELLSQHSCLSFNTNINNDNPLHVAAQYNKFSFINRLLLFEKAFVDKLDAVNSYQPMVKCTNRSGLTPFQLAIVKGHSKCVEELMQSPFVDLEVTETENNYSIYHLCILHSNLETLRIFLNKKSDKFLNPLFIRSKKNETPLHLACKLGQLDSFKQIYAKLNVLYSHGIESYLKALNKQQQNCFHLACIHDHYQIIEYCLRDLKLKYFLELTDQDLNTCLMLAADNDCTQLAELLTKYGADLKTLNKDSKTAFEIACHKGFIETSKHLIHNASSLHSVIYKGSNELIRLLLDKGVHIDSLDENKQNCLDLAINENKQECIKVLLSDKNWYKLFEDNKQINALFNAKMFDSIELILDNCKLNANSFNFRLLDPRECSQLSEHPMMRLAECNQARLLQHETTQCLLRLKWLKIPRLLFYSNLFLNFLFLFLFAIYTFDLEVNEQQQQQQHQSIKRDLFTSNKSTKKLFPIIYFGLITLLSVHWFKMAFILVNSFRFLLRFETWLEITMLTTALISITSTQFEHKINFSTLTLIVGVIHFLLLLQMVSLIGLYVIAFKKCCLKSLKLLPLFCLVVIVFIVSFRAQLQLKPISSWTNETNSYYYYSLIHLNRLEYTYFILVLVLIVLVNLWIGIAVDEIRLVMSKSLNEQTAKKLEFSLRVQNAFKWLINRNKCFKRLFNMTFHLHSFDASDLKPSKDSNVKSLIFVKTELISQISDLELNLNNKQQRLEDTLVELSRNSLTNFESSQQTSLEKLSSIEINFIKSQVELRNSLFDLKNYVILKFSSLKQSLVQTIRNFEYDSFDQNLKLLTSLDSIHEKTNYITDSAESIKQMERDEFKAVSNNFMLMDSRLSLFQIELDRLVKKMESVESQITVSDYKLNVIDILVRKETFTAKLDQVIDKLDELNERQFRIESCLTKFNCDNNNIN